MTGNMSRAYAGFMEAASKIFGTSSCVVSVANWKTNETVFSFALSPNLCHEELHLIRHSSIVLKLCFSIALRESIVVYVYETRDDLIEVDLEKNIKMISPIIL